MACIIIISWFQHFQSEVFDDIAHEAINLCRHSLKVAADNISTKAPLDSRNDGLLFFIRHLLILKDMASALKLKERDSPGQSVKGRPFNCTFVIDILIILKMQLGLFCGARPPC